MNDPGDHSKWDDSLQDWLDGQLNAADGAAFEAHLGRCALCQRSLAKLEELDAALIEATPPMALNAAFDERLFARIDAIDESKRAEARRREEQQWQEQLQTLAHNWRRTLAFVLPGIVGGIVLAVALMSWLDASGVTGSLIAQGAARFGISSVEYLRIGITGLVGAGFGILVAPWLARLAE